MGAGPPTRARTASSAARQDERAPSTMDLGGSWGHGDLSFSDGNAGHAGFRPAMSVRLCERNGLGAAISDVWYVRPNSQQRVCQAWGPDDGSGFRAERFEWQAGKVIPASRRRGVAELLGDVVCAVPS